MVTGFGFGVTASGHQFPSGSTRTPETISKNGTVTLDTTNKQFGAGSASFANSGANDSTDYLYISDATVGNFSSAWTIELWFRCTQTDGGTGTGGGEIIACQAQGAGAHEGWSLLLRNSGRVIFTSANSDTTVDTLISSNSQWSQNTWHHCAIVYDSGVGIYVDGSRVAYNSGWVQVPAVDSGDAFVIGSNIYGISSGKYAGAPKGFLGQIDEYRISTVARYSGTSYTVPTAEFVNDDDTKLLMHMNTASFPDDGG